MSLLNKSIVLTSFDVVLSKGLRVGVGASNPKGVAPRDTSPIRDRSIISIYGVEVRSYNLILVVAELGKQKNPATVER